MQLLGEHREMTLEQAQQMILRVAENPAAEDTETRTIVEALCRLIVSNGLLAPKS